MQPYLMTIPHPICFSILIMNKNDLGKCKLKCLVSPFFLAECTKMHLKLMSIDATFLGGNINAVRILSLYVMVIWGISV